MDIPGLPARKAALRLLDAVLRRGETLETAAHGALAGLRGKADGALALALAGETLRWLTDLDALIDSATRQPLPNDAKPRAVLRLMLAGWLRLETPPHAVIATGLPLLAGGPRRLAHGVFSTLTKQQAVLPAVPSLPEAVRDRWGASAEAIAAGLATPPPLDLALRDRDATDHWATRLRGASFMPGHVRIARAGPIEDLPGFAEGAWWVQDFAAGLPARLLGSGKGRTVLDLCAAPGGKTMQLAAAGWNVTALDLSQRRLDRLKTNLARTGLSAETVQANALSWDTAERFDAVLLDAPCTATGTCRRHPDVLHRIGSRQIDEMSAIQRSLLDRAADWLKPVGRLVYAVCSLEQDEGEERAARVTLTPEPILPEEVARLIPTAQGWLRTDPGLWPDRGGMDGFFVARWRR